MTKKNKTEEIIKKIKEENIQPTPKWQGHFYNVFFWLAVGLAVVLSSVAFSFFVLTLFEIPLEIFREFHLGRYIKIIFQALPYFWLILILVTMTLGLLAFQKTKHGYRYQVLLVVGAGIALMVLLGLIFNQYKISQSFKNLAERPIPQGLRGGVLNRGCFIDEGLLGGEIIKIGEELIYIKNPRGEEWKVIVESDAVVKSWNGLEPKDRVLVIGEKKDRRVFKASVVKEVGERFKGSPGQGKLMGQGFHHN